MHGRPGRPAKYPPEVWEHCRALARRGASAEEIEFLTDIPRGTLTHRRWVETRAGTHDWGGAPNRPRSQPRRFTRRCWSCQQLATQVTLDGPCPHCGYDERKAS